ncbi:methyltransferase [Actinosynnema sp. NPDC050801]|uniref:methyltransferase n=1 Tax=unclassified Actinosynnema TaxID=2637065 RepID=UPI0033D9F827
MATSPDTNATARRAVVDLVFGSMASQVVAAYVKLGIPNVIGGQDLSADDVAAACGTQARATRRLLRAATALGLLSEDDGRFSATPAGALLRSDVPGSVDALARVFTDPVMLRSWHRLDDSVRTGRTAFDEVFGTAFFDHLASEPDLSAAFNTAMSQGTHTVAGLLPDAYDFGRFGSVVDVGGGDGTLLAAILRRHTGLRGVLLDTAEGSGGAGVVLQDAGVSQRCTVAVGDFFTDVPAGSDAVLLKSILHDWDDERATTILGHCRRALPDDGCLLVVEPVLPDTADGTVPPLMYLSDLNMMVNLGGQERTRAEFATVLHDSGFTLTGVTPLPPSGFRLLEALPR